MLASKILNYCRKFALLFVLLVVVLLFYLYGGFDLVRWDNIRMMKDQLLTFVEIKPYYALLLFFGIYATYTVSSIPGLFMLDFLAGLLFGRFLGSFMVIIAASIGALLIFLAARYAFSDFFQRKTEGWTYKLRAGFEKNQKSYLLFLRIVPFVPFGIVNIALAFLSVRTWTYFWTTALGIVPICLLNVHFGCSLAKLIDSEAPITPTAVFNYEIALAFGALTLLALLPILLRKRNKA